MQRSKAPWFKAFLPLLVLSLTACLPINADVPDLTTFLGDFLNPGFLISPNPKELTTTQGGSAAIQLTIAPKDDFPGGTVNLKLVSPPNGVSLSPSSVRVGSYKVTKTLTIYTTADTPVGRHTLTLEATSGKIRRNTTLTLTVKQAPAFTVNTTADTIDTRPGDGTCADIEGNCSLRAAVMEANALTTLVVINIPAGTYRLTHISRVAEQGGDLDIKKDVTLKGAGAGRTILDGNGADRVLHIYEGAMVRVEGVTIQNGKAGGGGGIYNRGALTLTNSTVSGNAAGGSGGGIFNNDGATLTLTNSTVSGNRASYGGGVYNDGNLYLSFSTLTLNQASVGGGIYIRPGMVKLKGVILAGNTSESGSGPECSGNLTSRGYNLIGNSADCSFTAQDTDITGQDPLLGELTENGGPTKTHLPQANSPVLDKVPSEECTDLKGKALSTDGRGVTRPQGAACDIGAVERKPSE